MDARRFRDKEKNRYQQTKPNLGLFTPEAQQNGHYNNVARPFCLADECSSENLYRGVRDSAIAYFLIRDIPWHNGLKAGHLPSNHLCCSQSCCVNFLFPLMKRPDLVKSIFSFYYPEIVAVLPIVADKPLTDGTSPFLAFEWTGNPDADYLNEGKRKGRKPTRGANFTSADFIIRFRENGGQIHVVLREWKYREEYGKSYKGSGHQGDVRRETYIDFFKKQGGVFSANRDADRLYDELFYEPFYQLMRLQLLAQEMEANREMDADIVSVLLVSPDANKEFRNSVPSAYLRDKSPAKGVPEIWGGLVPHDKFTSASTENLLVGIANAPATDEKWLTYLKSRYGWSQ